MQRIKITIPTTFTFTCTLPVTINTINYGNHVGNDAFFAYAHNARIQWLKTIGYTELNINGLGLIMLDAKIQYLTQVHHGSLLHIGINIAQISQNGFTLIYYFECENEAKTIKKAAIIESNLLFFNYTTQKIAETPEEFKIKCH